MKRLKKWYRHTKKWVDNNRVEALFLVVLLVLASFLRLYNLRDSIVFLGDEGRDALAVKQIVIDLDPTFLGPTASVGGFYLGPVYYYMIAPFMLLFGMDPVGGAVFVALLGVATVALLYLIIRTAFDKISAASVALLYAVSPGVIRYSRSSWNPNPLPFFSLAAVFSFYLGLKQKKLLYFFVVGVFLGIIIQLHYLGLILCGAIGLMTLLLQKRKLWLKTIAMEFLGFLVGASMYLVFELRHGFLNIRSVIEFITRSGGAARPRNFNFGWLFYEVNRFTIEAVLNDWAAYISTFLAYLLLLAFVVTLAYMRKKKKRFSLAEKVLLLYWFITSLAFCFYRGQQYYHYFMILYPAPYILLAFILHRFKGKRIQLVLFGFSLLASIFLVSKAPTWSKGSKLVDQTEKVADQVISLAGGDPYNFALITPGNSDHAYRFFLEIKDQDPTPLDEKVEPQLLVVCEKWPEDTCSPLGNPLWEIAGFGRAEIAEQTTVYPRITVYRLIHHQDSLDKIGKPAK